MNEQTSGEAASPAYPKSPAWGRFGGLRLKLLALGASLALALLAGETAVRVFFHDEVDTSVLRGKLDAIFHLDGVVEPSDNAALVVELKRGILEDSANILVATDLRAPARISTIDPPPPDPAVRIALIGDSTSFGLGLHYDATYPAMLRTLLEETFHLPVEVRNYSVPMYNSTQERIIFETHVAAWKPDLLILHYDHNDADPASDHPYTHLKPEFGGNPLHSALLKLARRRLRILRAKASFWIDEKRNAGRESFHEGHRHAGPRYENHLKEIDRIGKGAARLGIPAAALIFDWNLSQFDNPEDDPHHRLLHPRLAQSLEASGFLVLDMYPRYQRHMKTQGWRDLEPFYLSKGDRSHPNSTGHLFLAQRLQEFILQRDALRAPFVIVAGTSPDAGLAEGIAAAKTCQQAYLSLDRGKSDEAVKLFRAAIARKPNDPGLHMSLATVFVRQFKVDEAIAALERVIRLKPDYAWAHLDLGDLYAHRKRFEDAIRHHRIVADLPANEAIRKAAVRAVSRSYEGLSDEAAANGDRSAADAHLRTAITVSNLVNDRETADRLHKKLEGSR